MRSELEGAEGLRLRVPWWLRLWLRARYLPVILRTGRLPAARAPREARPGPGPFARSATLSGLDRAVAAFESAVDAHWDRSGAGLTHHLFGRLSISKGVRLAAVHTEHHTRQLPGSTAQPSDRP